MIVIDGYEIDVARSVEHRAPAEITEHPIEAGSTSADHKIVRPMMLTIEGVVSDSPIGSLAVRRQQFALVDGEAFGLPSQEARARMEALLASPEPITIETPSRTYTSMVMEDLSAPEDRQTGHAYVFTATFKQIKIITNLRTTIRVAASRSSKSVTRGNKPGTEIADPAPAYLLR